MIIDPSTFNIQNIGGRKEEKNRTKKYRRKKGVLSFFCCAGSYFAG
jgi:hypothetical protein